VVISVTGERPYEVVIGRGITQSVAESIPPRTRQVAIIHQETMGEVSARLAGGLSDTGVIVTQIAVPDGEGAKTAEVASDCWARLGRAAFTRSDMVVSVGGGATTDLAGFVAATWLRGVDVVHVPTTLLAMVDAAVGGKTGINTGEGKNLVGSFHEPRSVYCDLDLLATLPTADLRAGLAEVIKVGFTSDPVIVDLIEHDPLQAVDPSSEVIGELISRAISVKAAVVAADLRESSQTGIGREVLNYGHTFAHALEHAENYRWRHGDAVSVGITFEAHLAHAAGVLDADIVARQSAVLRSIGLPTTYAGPALTELIEVMKVDKKSRGDLLRFVVIRGVGEPFVLAGPKLSELASAYAAIGEGAK
jgi:3-dehydroquinate synthase